MARQSSAPRISPTPSSVRANRAAPRSSNSAWIPKRSTRGRRSVNFGRPRSRQRRKQPHDSRNELLLCSANRNARKRRNKPRETFEGVHTSHNINRAKPASVYRGRCGTSQRFHVLSLRKTKLTTLRMKLRRMRRLASDPHLTALEVFLLPDRHDFLEPVDRKSACLERLRAMRRRDRDRNRRLADIDESDSMLNRDAHNLPTLP